MSVPPPPSVPRQVAFDHAAAAAAAAECERAAVRLREATGRRLTGARQAQQEWRGPHRDTFDAHLAGMRAGAVGLDADLRRTAAVLRDAMAAARVEQARRDAAWQGWQRARDAAREAAG